MRTSGSNFIFEIEGDCFYEQNPPFNFLDLGPDHSAFRDSWAVIIPVPYDATTTYQPGARNGPFQIIQASRQLELYDDEMNIEVYKRGICTLSPVETEVKSPERMVAKIKSIVSYVKEHGKLPVLIGGEHLVSVGAMMAFADEPNFKVVHFDAHADMREYYQGSTYSNACVMRLISGLCDFISVGVRSLSREEHEFIKVNRIENICAIDVVEDREAAAKRLLNFLDTKVYVTIDLDVLDPSIMPSVGTPEPGGLSWYDLTFLLKKICEKSEIVGFDVVELSPQPGNIAPDFIAAKLIYKILSYSGYYLDKNLNL